MTQRLLRKQELQIIMELQTLTEPQNVVPYKINEVQGECLLKEIKCLRYVQWKFALFVGLSIVTIGIPLLFCYWYPSVKRWFYFDFCTITDATHFHVLNYDDVITIVDREIGVVYRGNMGMDQTTYFINRFMKYFYDTTEGCFTAVTYDYLPRVRTILKADTVVGYQPTDVNNLRECYGEGVMMIPTPGCPLLFVREILQPFFFFIIYSVILWYYQKYIYYASIILFISMVTIGINLWQIMQLNSKIFQMAYYQVKMHCMRGNSAVEVSSVDLVPGDIVFIKNSIKLPFDGILLGGSVLMNECALTGESVPIVKKGVDKQQFDSKNILDKSCLLFQGTEIVQLCSKSYNPTHIPFAEYGLMVCVTRTNFATIKGQLIRIITFPKDREMKFYVESAKFIVFLFFLSVISYGILLSKLSKIVPADQLALKFFDLITITVPPGLPASMSVGIAYSIKRLKQCDIFCISPDKIILGGRINHICFDKTGTLTELFMDFYEFIPKVGKLFKQSINLQTKNEPINVSVLSKNESLQAQINMASCHSIMNLQQTGQLTGDPMEIKLFEFGGFTLSDQSSVMSSHSSNLFSFKGPSIQGTVFRRFQFDSDIHRMSVIAVSTVDPKNAYVYCKGSPESLVKIMKPDGIPEDYFDVLNKYTSCGFRVLTVASKPISLNQIESIDRDRAETLLDFNGFQVFENKLKPETVPSIQVLKQAQISIVIITGDNVLTGANIGFKSGVIEPYLNIMICQMKNDWVKVSNFYESETVKKPMSDYYQGMDQVVSKTKQLKQKTQTDFECSIDELPYKAVQIGRKGQYVFCVTGQVFQEIFSGEDNNNISQISREFINYIKVFARSKPNDKTKAISIFQSLGRVTAMCGDGANDCGALKQADAGLSLSDAEASISAPFTSKVPNISSMVSLIRQCRGGLATNFSLFNIMALYSLTQYTSTVIMQYFFAYPSDLQYLYWDLGCNFFFFLTIGYTASEYKLSKLIPSDSLFSLSNIFCVIFMFITQLVAQVITLVIMSNNPFSDYVGYWLPGGGGDDNNLQKFNDNDQQFILQSYQGTALFMVANFMYLFSVIAFSISFPWKRPFWTNLPFVIVYLIIFVYSVLICVVPAARIPGFNMDSLDERFNAMILGVGLIFGSFMYINQKFILEPFFGFLREKYPNKKWL